MHSLSHHHRGHLLLRERAAPRGARSDGSLPWRHAWKISAHVHASLASQQPQQRGPALLHGPSALQKPRAPRRRPSSVCWSSLAPEPIPEDVKLEVNPDASAKQATYDEQGKVVRIPLSALGDGQRRTKMVMFTCNKCGGRSARLVNPVAWDKGAVFAQCQHCDVWHTLAAHPSIIEEVRYNDPDWQLPQAAQGDGHAAGADSGQSSGTTVAGPPSEVDDDASSSAAAAAGGQQQQQQQLS